MEAAKSVAGDHCAVGIKDPAQIVFICRKDAEQHATQAFCLP
jgi:hypothetical protein